VEVITIEGCEDWNRGTWHGKPTIPEVHMDDVRTERSERPCDPAPCQYISQRSALGAELDELDLVPQRAERGSLALNRHASQWEGGRGVHAGDEQDSQEVGPPASNREMVTLTSQQHRRVKRLPRNMTRAS